MLQDLARQWAGKPDWTLLDTAFQDGRVFADVCQLWSTGAASPKLLHYVAITGIAPTLDIAARQMLDAAATDFDHVYPGFNRILLAQGRISLTLCIGPLSKMLAELRVQADGVLLDNDEPASDAEALAHWTQADWKQLALNCRAGARLYLPATGDVQRDAMQRQGFQVHQRTARFAPGWNIKRNRRFVNQPIAAMRCAIIGAGLSGAAIAHVLALRGWQVSVYDANAMPAEAASGVPVGLCVPQSALDDHPPKRLSRQGVRICLSHTRNLLAHGQDWKYTGVLEKVDPSDPQRDVMHTHAAWVKPALLTRAWLNNPAIQWLGGRPVHGLQRVDAQWVLQGPETQEWGRADHIVLANALGSTALIEALAAQVPLAEDVLRKLRALQALHGSLSWGRDTSPEPGIPLNGSGSWIAGVPAPAGACWYAGATYETDLLEVQNGLAQQRANLVRLRTLCVQCAEVMAEAMNDASIQSWSGTRCVSHDRLPLVGPLEASAAPTLWISTGMGSRGLSLSALCAELLAAYMHSEPLPLEASLAKSLSVLRPARGRSAHPALDLAN